MSKAKSKACDDDKGRRSMRTILAALMILAAASAADRAMAEVIYPWCRQAGDKSVNSGFSSRRHAWMRAWAKAPSACKIRAIRVRPAAQRPANARVAERRLRLLSPGARVIPTDLQQRFVVDLHTRRGNAKTVGAERAADAARPSRERSISRVRDLSVGMLAAPIMDITRDTIIAQMYRQKITQPPFNPHVAGCCVVIACYARHRPVGSIRR